MGFTQQLKFGRNKKLVHATVMQLLWLEQNLWDKWYFFSNLNSKWKIIHHRCYWNAFSTLRLDQNCRHSADSLFECIFLNENVCILFRFDMYNKSSWNVWIMWLNEICKTYEICLFCFYEIIMKLRKGHTENSEWYCCLKYVWSIWKFVVGGPK